MSNTMYLRMPHYYKNFRCTADKCSDSCCIGWEIDVDRKTYDFYKTVSGAFGEKLRCNISELSVPHFILDKNERCPFLNDRNLCEIFINLGEDRLCGICTEHPRFYEWYDGIKEGGIGLCCEAAAETIITQKGTFSYYDIPVTYEESREYDEEFYEYLFEMRENIIRHMENTSIPFSQRLNNILFYAHNMQNRYDNFEFEMLPIETHELKNNKADFSEILREFSQLELLDNRNRFSELYESCDSFAGKIFDSTDFDTKAFENITVYFIWRHFLKSVYEDEFYSKIAFSVISTVIIAVLCTSEKQSFSIDKLIRACVYYSKEVEYNETSLSRIFDNFYENDAFSVSKISSLLNFF
ncbi:MAG: flagellin lysine-N-methylase [Oscillospiraceae bacterium]|nr:flagellin lysine-N-methylase [Oscillospiraceae bacterium]